MRCARQSRTCCTAPRAPVATIQHPPRPWPAPRWVKRARARSAPPPPARASTPTPARLALANRVRLWYNRCMSTHTPSPFPVLFGGSRSLPSSSAPLVRSWVAAALAAGCVHVATGCCTGADALVIHAALAHGPQCLRVFVAFGPGGLGSAGSVSAVADVAEASRTGARVSYWSGGPASVPVAARLAQRSAAAVRACAAVILFSPGRGSLAATATTAASLGRPLYAVCPVAPAPVPGHAGAWQPAQLFGLPCWCWQPAQLSLF